MKSMRPSRVLLWALAALIVAADQLSKTWIVTHLLEYKPTDVIPWLAPVLSFTRLSNTGVAFGLFPQLGGLFTVLSAVVIVAIVIFHRSVEPGDWLTHGALGLMVGGAAGNLVDRLVHGHVIDFIDLNFWPFRSFAVFNLADACIVTGVSMLLVGVWIQERQAARVERAQNLNG